MWMWILWMVRPQTEELWTIIEIIVALIAGVGGVIVGWSELKKLRSDDRRVDQVERTVEHLETRVSRVEDREEGSGQVADHETRLAVLETRLEEQRKHYEHRLDEERRRCDERLDDLKRQINGLSDSE